MQNPNAAQPNKKVRIACRHLGMLSRSASSHFLELSPIVVVLEELAAQREAELLVELRKTEAQERIKKEKERLKEQYQEDEKERKKQARKEEAKRQKEEARVAEEKAEKAEIAALLEKQRAAAENQAKLERAKTAAEQKARELMERAEKIQLAREEELKAERQRRAESMEEEAAAQIAARAKLHAEQEAQLQFILKEKERMDEEAEERQKLIAAAKLQAKGNKKKKALAQIQRSKVKAQELAEERKAELERLQQEEMIRVAKLAEKDKAKIEAKRKAAETRSLELSQQLEEQEYLRGKLVEQMNNANSKLADDSEKYKLTKEKGEDMHDEQVENLALEFAKAAAKKKLQGINSEEQSLNHHWGVDPILEDEPEEFGTEDADDEVRKRIEEAAKQASKDIAVKKYNVKNTYDEDGADFARSNNIVRLSIDELVPSEKMGVGDEDGERETAKEMSGVKKVTCKQVKPKSQTRKVGKDEKKKDVSKSKSKSKSNEKEKKSKKESGLSTSKGKKKKCKKEPAE